jgi:prepilin-type processing-associated H-X9-DG protein
MKLYPALKFRKTGAFTLMELLVVIAIIIILASIAFPVWRGIQKKGYEAEATRRMQSLAAGALKYAQDNDGAIPNEDAANVDDWSVAALPTSEKAWYNAIPRTMGEKGVGDFVNSGTPALFYTKANILYLPGALYPQTKIMSRPYFAIAMNTKLHRKNKDDVKPELKLSNIIMPTRTVFFLEQGLPGEEKAHPSQSASNYDGSCKGSARSFVARYSGKGVIAFFDGHFEEAAGKDLLSPTGEIEFKVGEQPRYVWTRDPTEDPNK